MAIPSLPFSFTDALTGFRRIAETINNILNFKFDASRIRTPAEIALEVMPVNFAYATGDPRRYGADPTGVSVSTTAVQTALNVAYAAKATMWIGADCNFLVGALTITASGNRANDGLIIQGSAPNGSRLTQSGSPSAILTITGSTPTGNPQQFSFKLRDMAIHGSGNTAHGLALVGVSDATVENVYIGGCDRGIFGNSCLESRVKDSWIADNNYGCYFRADGAGSAANLIRLDDCMIDYNAIYGVDFDQGDELQMIGCDLEQNGTAGNTSSGAIHIGSSVNASPTYGFGKVWLQNLWLESNTGGYSIQVDAPTESQNVWITIRGGHTASSVSGNAINILGTGGAGHVTITEHYSGSTGDTWNITSAYATLQDVNVNVLNDSGVTYPSYQGVNTGSKNYRNGRTSTVTLTLTGCTTAPTVTASIYQQGDEVTLIIPPTGALATSNSTAATLTGLPAALYPNNDFVGSLPTTNSGTNAIWSCYIPATTGVIALGYEQTFTSSGQKGTPGGVLTWRIA